MRGITWGDLCEISVCAAGLSVKHIQQKPYSLNLSPERQSAPISIIFVSEITPGATDVALLMFADFAWASQLFALWQNHRPCLGTTAKPCRVWHRPGFILGHGQLDLCGHSADS